MKAIPIKLYNLQRQINMSTDEGLYVTKSCNLYWKIIPVRQDFHMACKETCPNSFVEHSYSLRCARCYGERYKGLLK